MKTQVNRILSIAGQLLLSLLVAGAQAQTADTVKTVEAEAQSFCRHEFSIWAAGGVSTLHYNPSFGERNSKAGGAFGMGYTFYFNPHWGLHTGAEVALYNTTFGLRNLKDSYTRYGFDDLTPNWTGANELIDYHTELQQYTEKQRLYNLNIPLMLQFQTPLAGGEHQFYAAAGAKFGIPLKGTYRVSDATLYTWYYDYLSKQEFRPDPTGYGNPYLEDLGAYYNLPYSTGKKASRFKVAGLASVEAGVKWHLSSKLSLYTGAYLDYGFTSIRRSGDNFFTFDPDQGEMTSNSIMTSQYTHNYGATKDFAEKVSPLSFGVKLRLGVNMCKVEKAGAMQASKGAGEPDAYRNATADNNGNATPFGRNGNNRPLRALPEERESYQTDPAWDVEMKRATAEYGKLKDLVILYVDGYELNQAYLSPTMKKMLDERLRILQKYNSDKYVIIAEGHTCDLGREDFNVTLGQKRAEVVREYMAKNGFNEDNLIATSKGKTTPIVSNTSEPNRKINRRVVFLIKERR